MLKNKYTMYLYCDNTAMTCVAKCVNTQKTAVILLNVLFGVFSAVFHQLLLPFALPRSLGTRRLYVW